MDLAQIVTTRSEAIEEEPSTSQDINDSVVVSGCLKRSGKRVYDKKHYCLFCSKAYAKMAHANTSDVSRALSCPKGSKERKKQLDYIHLKGNFAHNAAVMESGSLCHSNVHLMRHKVVTLCSVHIAKNFLLFTCSSSPH